MVESVDRPLLAWTAIGAPERARLATTERSGNARTGTRCAHRETMSGLGTDRAHVPDRRPGIVPGRNRRAPRVALDRRTEEAVTTMAALGKLPD